MSCIVPPIPPAAGGSVVFVYHRGYGRDRPRAYEAIDRIIWPEGFFRRDIGWRAIHRDRARG